MLEPAAAITQLLMPSSTVVVGQSPITLLIRIINYAVTLIELLLGLRFFLRLSGANAASGFVSFIYQLSDVFLMPFRGIFPRIVVEGSVLEWSTLFAMAIYGILGYALIQLILLMVPHSNVIHTSETVDVDTSDTI